MPQNDESAGKKKSTRIGKGNHWLKPLIVQCANAAKNSKKHPEIRDKYLALKKRRGYGKTIIAIAKRIMTALYYMLLRDEKYNPQTCMDRAPARGTIQLQNLINYYSSKGYTVVTDDGEVLQTA